MKATINREGQISILPENQTEDYALRRWWDAYTADDPAATLRVLFTETEDGQTGTAREPQSGDEGEE